MCRLVAKQLVSGGEDKGKGGPRVSVLDSSSGEEGVGRGIVGHRQVPESDFIDMSTEPQRGKRTYSMSHSRLVVPTSSGHSSLILRPGLPRTGFLGRPSIFKFFPQCIPSDLPCGLRPWDRVGKMLGSAESRRPRFKSYLCP